MTEREQGFRDGVEAVKSIIDEPISDEQNDPGYPLIPTLNVLQDRIRALTPPTDGAGALLRECLGWLRQSYAPEIDDLRKRIEAHLSGKDRT